MRISAPALLCLLAAAASARTASVGKSVDGNKEASVRLNILSLEEEGGPTEQVELNPLGRTLNSPGRTLVLKKTQLNWGSSGENGTSMVGGTSRTLGSTGPGNIGPADPSERKAVIGDWDLWPQNSDGVPIVKYNIGNTKVAQSTIRAAIAHYEEHTCLRFEEVSGFQLSPRVNFVAGSGCSSRIGRVPLSFLFGQGINLHETCDSVKIVVHEIGHAIGLFHEQSRSDRDAHVRINYFNADFTQWSNFNRQWFTRNYNTVYDFYSVMQYGPLSFSSNGGTTVASADPMLQGLLVYPRQGLSFMDKLIVNKLYRCTERWVSQCPLLVEDPCQNLGYIGPDCICRCPAGTSGNNCQVKVMNYTDALVAEYLPLNQKLTSPGTVSSPGYPVPQLDLVVFTKMITAPSCKRVVLTVVGFQLAGRDSTNRRCQDEGLEIRDSDWELNGIWYCGQDLQPGFTIKSKDKIMIIFYVKGSMGSNTNKGFSFDITFETIEGCTRR